MKSILLKGMTNVPPDRACSEGDLALCMGCVYEHGALAVVHPADADLGGDMAPDAEQYNVMLADVPMPVIEFALQHAGYVAMPQTVRLPASMCRVRDGDVAGSGAWSLHASTAIQVDNHESAARSVHSRLMQALANQVMARGYFYQPFMVRYAVRMSDGTYAAVSPPVPMFPALAPPCFAVASCTASGDDEVLLAFSNTSVSYSRLRLRIVRGLSADMAAKVVAVDIFCSKQMLTYHADAYGSDGVVDYAAMGGDRGGRCWQLLPDSAWESRMLACDKFYRVASISGSELMAREAFEDVGVSDSGDKALAQSQQLSVDAANVLRIKADAVAVHGEQLIVAGSSGMPPGVWPLRARMACDGDEDYEDLRLSVLVRDAAGDHSFGTDCKGSMQRIRYLYTDVPGAYAIALTCASGSIMMPLTPHATMPGSYWWGGTGDVRRGIIAIADEDVPAQSQSLGKQAVIEIRSVFNPWHLLSRQTLPDDKIWAVSSLDAGIAYVSPRGVHIVKGSKVDTISGSLTGTGAMDVAELPQIDDLLACAGLRCPGKFVDILAKSSLVYDRQANRLVLAVDDSIGYAYSMDSGKWGMCSLRPSDDGTVPVAIVTRPIIGAGIHISRVRVEGRIDASSCGVCIYGSHDLRRWHVVASCRGPVTDVVTGTRYRYYVLAFAGLLSQADHVTHIVLE